MSKQSVPPPAWPTPPVLRSPPAGAIVVISSDPAASTRTQGLTLVHFSAQRKRFLLDKGCT